MSEQQLDQGLRLYQTGQKKEAERIYRQVLADDPGNAVAWHLLGILALQTGREAEAVDHFRRSLSIDDENASVYSNLGIALDALGQLDQAEKCFRDALKRFPGFIQADNNLRLCLIRRATLRGDPASAEREIRIRQILKKADEFGMLQIPEEIEGLAKLVHDLDVRHFMEIGSHKGGSFYIWCQLARDPGKRICLDLPGGSFGGLPEQEIALRNQRMKTWGEHVYCLNADSHLPGTLREVEAILANDRLDFLMIDGDHSYEGVKQDYEMYGRLVRAGGWIAFHDINDTPVHRNLNCHVARLWGELTGEKIEFNEHDYWGGIGVLRKQ